PAPTRNLETLFRMLHTHLENLKTDAPIVAVQLRAKACPAENHQFRLFETALRNPNHFYETVARITALLGPDRVGTPVLEPTQRPWRTSGNWWEASWDRDEWDVQTRQGKLFRLYQEAGKWFVEGVFD